MPSPVQSRSSVKRPEAPQQAQEAKKPNKADEFLSKVKSFLGQPYLWGGGHVGTTFSKPGRVDCSGLVMQAARMAGFNLDGTAAVQQRMGKPVSMNDLKPGDL